MQKNGAFCIIAFPKCWLFVMVWGLLKFEAFCIIAFFQNAHYLSWCAIHLKLYLSALLFFSIIQIICLGVHLFTITSVCIIFSSSKYSLFVLVCIYLQLYLSALLFFFQNTHYLPWCAINLSVIFLHYCFSTILIICLGLG